MSRWHKYFTPPFRDTGIYIVDAEGRRIAHWLTDASARPKFIDKINGVLMTKSNLPFIYMDRKICIVAPNGKLVPIMLMRCWGYLQYCENPDFVQDEFAAYIVEQLNK